MDIPTQRQCIFLALLEQLRLTITSPIVSNPTTLEAILHSTNCFFGPLNHHPPSEESDVPYGELLHQCGSYAQCVCVDPSNTFQATYCFDSVSFDLSGHWQPAPGPAGEPILLFNSQEDRSFNLSELLLGLRCLNTPSVFWQEPRWARLSSSKSYVTLNPQNSDLQMLLVYESELWEIMDTEIVMESPQTIITRSSYPAGTMYRKYETSFRITGSVVVQTSVGAIRAKATMLAPETFIELDLSVLNAAEVQAVVSSVLKRSVDLVQESTIIDPRTQFEISKDFRLKYDGYQKKYIAAEVYLFTKVSLTNGTDLVFKGSLRIEGHPQTSFNGVEVSEKRLDQILPLDKRMSGPLGEMILDKLAIRIGPTPYHSRYIISGLIYDTELTVGQINFSGIKVVLYEDSANGELSTHIDGRLFIESKNTGRWHLRFEANFDEGKWIGAGGFEKVSFENVCQLLNSEIRPLLKPLFRRLKFVNLRVRFDLTTGTIQQMSGQFRLMNVDLSFGYCCEDGVSMIRLAPITKGVSSQEREAIYAHFNLCPPIVSVDMSPTLKIRVEF